MRLIQKLFIFTFPCIPEKLPFGEVILLLTKITLYNRVLEWLNLLRFHSPWLERFSVYYIEILSLLLLCPVININMSNSLPCTVKTSHFIKQTADIAFVWNSINAL